MARVMLTGRVTEAQAAALRAHAEAVGLPMYQATVRALELGIAALTGGREPPAPAVDRAIQQASMMEEVRSMMDRLATRAELSDRLVQRTLYAAGAAYAAALAGATDGAEPDRADAIKRDVARDAEAVFERQLARAREG